MELAVLGPLQVVDEATGPTVLPGRRLASVAAVLALHAQPVGWDELADAVWAGASPPSARKTLQGFVLRLRRVLGPGAIRTEPRGYLLDRARVTVDADRFAAALDEAERDADDHEALVRTKAALAMWRGRPFAELDDWPAAAVARAQLEERHRHAEERHAELCLRVQPSVDIVARLEALAVAEPLRERRWWLLVDALARGGRAAEALRAYERARTALVEALGAEPGPALQGLHRGLLDETAGPAGPLIRLRTGGLPRPRTGGLPRPRARFVGRGRELDEITRALLGNRLVTLHGPGGCGKTRTAIEIAGRWCDERGGAVAFADLTAVGDPAQVARAVSAAVLADSTGGPPGDVDAAVLAVLLARCVAHEGLLLVVDNAEHVAGGAAIVVDALLRGVPGVRVLVTSRLTLGVDGERRWPLGPLDHVDAQELYLDRARARQPGLHDSPPMRRAVAELCARLDNLPLAIELAAARVDVLGPAQLVARLTAGEGLPADPHRPLGGVARWSSLEAAVSWSIDALPSATRDAFTALSVLPDRFDLDVAAAVIGTGRDETLATLDALVDASLVVSSVDADTTTFTLLATLREQAERALLETPDGWRAAQDRLLAWALHTAGRYASMTEQGNGHRRAMAEVDALQHNLRAALDWAAAGGSVAHGLSVMARLEDWWRASGRTTEAWDRSYRLLSLAQPSADPADRRHVDTESYLVAATWTAAFGVHLVESTPAVQALVISTEQGIASLADPTTRLRLATQLRWLAWDLDGADGAAKLLALLEDSARLGGFYESTLLHFLTARYLQSDEPEAALASGRRCHEAAERAGNDVSRAHGAELLGCALASNGKLDEARDQLRAALDGLVEADHLGCVLHCLDSVAAWAAMAGTHGECRSLLGLIGGIRRDLRRVRHPLEQYGYVEAVRRCGEVEPTVGEDLVARALDLCDGLLGAPSSASRALSHPAWS